MSEVKVKQLPSRYFLKEGKHHIEYSFQIASGLRYFTDVACLWEGAVGTSIVNLNQTKTKASYVECTDYRAVKFSEEELSYIFKDLLVVGVIRFSKTTPEKFRVEGY